MTTLLTITSLTSVLLATVLALRVVLLNRRLASLRYAATHDPLTGLLNRTGLAHHWATLEPAVVQVAIVDLDGFKPVNDRYGHASGDLVLAAIANRLQALVPNAARLGGDEFVLVLPTGRVSELVARIVDWISVPVTLDDGNTVAVTGSVGLAQPRSCSADLAELLKDADAAMYRAKQTRTPVVLFDPRTDDRPTLAADPRPIRRTRDRATNRGVSARRELPLPGVIA